MYFKWIVVLVCSLFVIDTVSQSQCNTAQACFADVMDSDCPIPGQIIVPNAGIFGCCPGCAQPSGVDPGCKPPANCLPDGRYAPVQCKGDLFVGRCFCADELGRRIFGQTWRIDGIEMHCGKLPFIVDGLYNHEGFVFIQNIASILTACSRRRAEIESSGRLSTLHCTSTGDYEPLQCDNGLCWCAEPKTGQPTVTPVVEEDIAHLPCYSAHNVGEQYLRRCESIVHAMAKIHREQSEHGTTFHGHPTSFCDYDGSYGPYQISNGVAYCTGRDGAILGSWQVMSTEMTGMNCNCARDSSIYFPDKGMTVTETCTANGNYQPNQIVGDLYYCVDTDGYPTTDMLPAWPADRCGTITS